MRQGSSKTQKGFVEGMANLICSQSQYGKHVHTFNGSCCQQYDLS